MNEKDGQVEKNCALIAVQELFDFELIFIQIVRLLPASEAS